MQWAPIVAAFLRFLLLGLSTAGIYKGSVDEDTLMVAASGVISVATLIWSVLQKVQASKVAHQSAVASAEISADKQAPVVVPPKLPM